MSGDVRVSVIVPNYNKAKTLADCLRAVRRQTRAPAELIVVDDASTDASREIAAGVPCRLLTLGTNRGVSAARNAGAAAATGDVLFFVDSDIALAPDAIATALRVLRDDPRCAVVQGIYDAEPLVADGPVEVYKTLFEHYWRRQRAGVTDATLFALTAIRRQVFDEVGGFDENLRDAEDIEFGTRLPSRYTIRMSADVLGRHDDVDRLGPFLAEHVRRAVGYGALLAGTARWALPGRRQAEAVPAARPASGVDVGALVAMTGCTVALLTAPLVLLSWWLLAVPVTALAAFGFADRALFRFVRRRRGTGFLAYFVGMHFFMHTTQLAGMMAGFAAGLWRTVWRPPSSPSSAAAATMTTEPGR
ncbi:glycosyltransferase family 2 protein [Solwaraspora sp. WMMB335]|uniref:glycosyltransferase family 2 protein n=1 Tax=Solwaraspora sp. WMMB335 TaxID=3404118 RepID=UPI003B956DC4